MRGEPWAVRIEILTTGDELLEGVIADTNASYLAHEISLHGFSVHRISTVGDRLEDLCEEITQISRRAALCVITGGLGPTSDDMTLDALAMSAGLELSVDEELWRSIQERYARLSKVPSSNRRQARVPAGGEPLKSEVGTAPGMKLMIGDCLFIAYPGVPSELRWHVKESLAPLLQGWRAQPLTRLTWRVGGLGESALQERLNELSLPSEADGLKVGYQALGAEVRLKLSAAEPALLEAQLPALRTALGAHLISESDEPLERVLMAALKQRGLTMGCAESCTGGAVSARLTRVPGSSAVFLGGVTAYANEVKMSLLSVSQETLATHGAVSEPCALEMARGARAALKVDWALSVTGVAGPGGGSAEKPVGTVHFAWAGPQGERSAMVNLSGDRSQIQARATYYALHQLLQLVTEVA